MQAIHYRHYDMKDRIERSKAHHWFLIVTPMTTATEVHTAVMDNFGYPQRVNYMNLAASIADCYCGEKS